MKKLHVSYVKLAAAADGAGLDAATERKVVQEAVTLDIEGVEIEHLLSTSPNPQEIVEDGSKIKARAVLADATYQDLVDIFGGTYVAELWEKNQDPRTLTVKDFRMRVQSTELGKFYLMDLTNVYVVPKVTFSFAPGKRYYMPLEIKGSSETVIRRDDSNA